MPACAREGGAGSGTSRHRRVKRLGWRASIGRRSGSGLTRRAHTLSQLLEDGVSIRAADMPGAGDLMLRIYAAMAQKESELISERTWSALAADKARGKVLGGDRGFRPASGPDAAAAAVARREAANQTAHRLHLELERSRAEGVVGLAELARALTDRGVPTPRGGMAWTHTTVARVLTRATSATCGLPARLRDVVGRHADAT
ncbi:recombinase family protein [Neoroseomonas lacus]|uniref:Recombinase family protein n=1 Tax=Neoroseomonas lacus TaxID=287609 RepID=A0A917L3M0_9PROT|nr:recombinase family protein [Neoroseomonas lacus]GGJ43099.1 hypothetical protein GCM10011320_58310 [Neoroseomonas lacus]